MSPLRRSISTLLILPPRLGTSCHMHPLALLMLTGFRSWKLAVYSTLPLEFLGASWTSWMMALRGSFGSSSPVANPAIASYSPTSPKEQSGGRGACAMQDGPRETISIFVTLAWDGCAQVSSATARAAAEGSLPPGNCGSSGLISGFLLAGRGHGRECRPYCLGGLRVKERCVDEL